MALFDEELVQEWLNRQGYFTMRGIKVGHGEIDLLAVKLSGGEIERRHVEVNFSVDPVGYFSGDASARGRDDVELASGIDTWIAKKFEAPAKLQRMASLAPGGSWKRTFVHGKVNEEKELLLLRDRGIETINYRTVVNQLVETRSRRHASVASSVIDVLTYLKREEGRAASVQISPIALP